MPPYLSVVVTFSQHSVSFSFISAFCILSFSIKICVPVSLLWEFPVSLCISLFPPVSLTLSDYLHISLSFYLNTASSQNLFLCLLHGDCFYHSLLFSLCIPVPVYLTYVYPVLLYQNFPPWLSLCLFVFPASSCLRSFFIPDLFPFSDGLRSVYLCLFFIELFLSVWLSVLYLFPSVCASKICSCVCLFQINFMWFFVSDLFPVSGYLPSRSAFRVCLSQHCFPVSAFIFPDVLV
jgi:hypothetical protein